MTGAPVTPAVVDAIRAAGAKHHKGKLKYKWGQARLDLAGKIPVDKENVLLSREHDTTYSRAKGCLRLYLLHVTKCAGQGGSFTLTNKAEVDYIETSLIAASHDDPSDDNCINDDGTGADGSNLAHQNITATTQDCIYIAIYDIDPSTIPALLESKTPEERATWRKVREAERQENWATRGPVDLRKVVADALNSNTVVKLKKLFTAERRVDLMKLVSAHVAKMVSLWTRHMLYVEGADDGTWGVQVEWDRKDEGVHRYVLRRHGHLILSQKLVNGELDARYVSPCKVTPHWRRHWSVVGGDFGPGTVRAEDVTGPPSGAGSCTYDPDPAIWARYATYPSCSGAITHATD
jgi:hypothetical protein